MDTPRSRKEFVKLLGKIDCPPEKAQEASEAFLMSFGSWLPFSFFSRKASMAEAYLDRSSSPIFSLTSVSISMYAWRDCSYFGSLWILGVCSQT